MNIQFATDKLGKRKSSWLTNDFINSKKNILL